MSAELSAEGAGHLSYGHDIACPTPLTERYPHTAAAFAAMGALDHLDRIAQLDAIWDEIRRPTP
ncbi:MAG: hypothetical protein ACJ8CR_09320, partial [Roseiflexaceae bacterium]